MLYTVTHLIQAAQSSFGQYSAWLCQKDENLLTIVGEVNAVVGECKLSTRYHALI